MATPSPGQPAPILHRRRNGPNGAAVIIGGLLLAGAGWLVWQFNQRPPPVEAPKAAERVVEVAKPLATEPKPEIIVVEPKPAPPTPSKRVEAPPMAPPKPVITEARSPYPFDSGSLNDPKKLAALISDTRERLADGQWERHLSRLEQGLVVALAATAGSDGVERHTRLWENRLFALGLSQSLFLRRLTPETLRTAAADQQVAPFLNELLVRAEAMEKFAVNLKQQDDPAAALRVWAQLVADDKKEQRGRYENLQIACALVFDRPFGWARMNSEQSFTADALTRYRYFRNNAELGRLAADIRKLQPYELVWVVGANVTEDEMTWALNQSRLRTLSEWAPSYGMIRYRLDYVTHEKTKLPAPTEGTLREIFEIGGVCVHQAHFAANTARAFGIPAAAVSGDGNRGGHAWFAYLRKDRDWNMNTGRYNDGYACGHTTDPQTGESIGEFEVQILGDAQRKTTLFTKGLRLQAAAQVCAAQGQFDNQRDYLRGAVSAASRCLEAWRAYADCLEALGPKVKTEEWRAFVVEMRRVFDDWPDLRELADLMEQKHLFPKMTEDEIFLSCKRAYDRLMSDKKRHGEYDRTRYDLIQKALARESEVLMKDRVKNADRLAALHRKALEDNADHLPTFRQLLDGYYEAVKGDARMEQLFLSEIERVYKRRLSGNAGGDVFRLQALAGTLELIQGYFDKCGDTGRAKRLATESLKIQKTLEKMKK